MNRRHTVILLFVSVLLLVAVAFFVFPPMNRMRSPDPAFDNGAPRMGMNNMHMGGTAGPPLSLFDQAAAPLTIPPLLEGTSASDGSTAYTVTAQEGVTEMVEGMPMATYGYNGSFLGPVIRLRQGQTVTIKTENHLDTATSFHWHGLKVPSNVDGGPHSPIPAGGTADLEFTVNQEAATLWFHPHPVGSAGEQVYQGLAGLLYIEDAHSDALALPKEYGINDFPLIVQDRLLSDGSPLNYSNAYTPDGAYGDTLIVNGTINPYLDVKDEQIRLRLLNGSNARNYQFQLADGSSFHQIASDGGFLNEPVAMRNLQLVPGERAEIVIDLSGYAQGESVQLMEEDIPVLTLNVREDQPSKAPSLPTELNTLKRSENTGIPDKTLTFSGMGHMVAIDGKQFDMERIDLRAKARTKEVWEIHNDPDMMGGMIHPFHLHGVQFQVLSRNGEEPPENERGWKDTIALYPGESVRIAVEFPEPGVFMYHCHILEHEDSGMMGQVLVE